MEMMIEKISEKDESEVDLANLISWHRFPEQRCYVLPMNNINGCRYGAYVFVMYPDENRQVGLIV